MLSYTELIAVNPSGKITDASIFRNQSKPNPQWTSRFSTMEMKAFTDWHSGECRTVSVSNDFEGCAYDLELRRFKVRAADRLYEMWAVGNDLKTRDIPPFAIANIEQAAHALEKYVNNSIGPAMRKCVATACVRSAVYT